MIHFFYRFMHPGLSMLMTETPKSMRAVGNIATSSHSKSKNILLTASVKTIILDESVGKVATLLPLINVGISREKNGDFPYRKNSDIEYGGGGGWGAREHGISQIAIFLGHKQANINVESRRFGVIMTPFSRQSE